MRSTLQAKAKTPTSTPPSFTSVQSGLLQRKCACGGTPGPTGECETCRKKRESKTSQPTTSFRSSLILDASEAPSIVHNVLRSSAQPLDKGKLSRLGHDFSRVPITVHKGEVKKTGQFLQMSTPSPSGDQSKLSEIESGEETEDVTESLAGVTSEKVENEPMDVGKTATPVRKCKVKSGPTYSPSGTIGATKSGGGKNASFGLSAEFENDSAKGSDSACCEVRQYILWTKATDIPRNAAFKPAASFKDNNWYEDRDTNGKRYGHRTGPYSECVDINHYEGKAAKKDCAKGHVYKGQDAPRDGSGAKTGEWRFNLKVVDTCDVEKQIGTTAAVTVDWDTAPKELEKPERSLAPPVRTVVAPR